MTRNSVVQKAWPVLTGLVAVPSPVVVLVIGRIRGRKAGVRTNFTALPVVALVDVALLIITGGAEL
ncbi:hypothetical protein [Lentzea sp. HUAS12]|uniref:hypothetical protein n=1 Tax=Lentzea sp. HUAS12 TaxID=2951806 RepID=UPI00209FC515|nr:hypothetical protein [Lentzea sp. HUAS12]USX53539.1 hypothetical protein ND450_05390 [Lentzea sp. HUAS12]